MRRFGSNSIRFFFNDCDSPETEANAFGGLVAPFPSELELGPGEGDRLRLRDDEPLGSMLEADVEGIRTDGSEGG